jgi:transposase InsO family protein
MSSDEIPLQAQVMIEPFKKWALDFVGPISPMSRRKNYILVCTDHVTKWVEAKSLFRAMDKSVVEFIYEDIFTHFGVPREIVTDQGTQFTSKLMKELTEIYGIKHCKSSPYHPQANGQVESTNKVMEAILTKTVQLNHRYWADRLPKALWSYQTTWRNTTGHTPYELVYRKQAILPIEFQVRTFRIATELGLSLDEAQRQ